MTHWEEVPRNADEYFKVRYICYDYPPLFTKNKIYPAAYGKDRCIETGEIEQTKGFDVADNLGERYCYDNSLFEILRDENGNLIPWTEADGDIGK